LARESVHILGADVFALRECGIPLYVKMNRPECLRQHAVAGTQQKNMRGMARARRGGGRPTIRGLGAKRSVALRDAVRDSAWDAAAVYSAFLGSEPRLFCAPDL
jgi:hypothetical protein